MSLISSSDNGGLSDFVSSQLEMQDVENDIQNALKRFVTRDEVLDRLLRDLFETIENMSSTVDNPRYKKTSNTADDVTFFIKKCEGYMQKVGRESVMRGRDRRLGLEGNTLLHTASRIGNMPIVAYLIDNGAEVDAIDTSGTLRTPIYVAISCNMFDVAVLLAKAGANLKHIDINRENVFHHIARKNSTNTLKRIAEHLNAQDVQMLASSHSITKKKSLPEMLATPNTLTFEVLQSFRETGIYQSWSDTKNGAGSTKRSIKTMRNNFMATSTTAPGEDNTGENEGIEAFAEEAIHNDNEGPETSMEMEAAEKSLLAEEKQEVTIEQDPIEKKGSGDAY